MLQQGVGAGEKKRQKTKYEITAAVLFVEVSIVCRGEFLMHFLKHGRTECVGCQKEGNSIALELEMIG